MCSQLSGLKTGAGNPRQGKSLNKIVPGLEVKDGIPKVTSLNCKNEMLSCENQAPPSLGPMPLNILETLAWGTTGL